MDEDLDRLQASYRAAVEAWVALIRKEEDLAAGIHSVSEIDKWEQAHFEEDEARSSAKAAKAAYEDGLRKKFFGF
jgi:hypothetical protein